MQPLRLLFLSGLISLAFHSRTHAQETMLDLYYSGRYEQVIRISAEAMASGDTTFNTFYLKALSEVQVGRNESAIHTLEQAAPRYPGDARINRMLAAQYYEAGDYVKAAAFYSSMVRLDSSDVAAWLKLAEIASFTQHYPRSVACLEQVLLLDSANLGSLVMLGEILSRQNDSSAVVYYQRAYRIYPDNQKVAYALGNWHIQSGTPEEAVPVCERMLEADSTSIRFQKLLGLAYYKTGKPASAIRHFRKATVLGDSTAFTFKFMGISCFLNMNFADAIASLRIAVAKDSMDAESHFFLGSCLGTTTLKEEAMDHLDRSLELMNPDPAVTARIYSEQANIMRLEMKHEAAYDLYSRAWKADTTNPMYLYFMASILDNSMHRSRESLVDYRRFIRQLDLLPPESVKNDQMPAIRNIVEDRITLLNEELFFLDEKEGSPE